MKHRENYTIVHRETGCKISLNQLVALKQSDNNDLTIGSWSYDKGSSIPKSKQYRYNIIDVFFSSDFIHLPFLLNESNFDLKGIALVRFLEQFEHQSNKTLADLEDALRLEHELKQFKNRFSNNEL